MDFTKEQLSEVLCKHAERENGLQDLMEIMIGSMMVAKKEHCLAQRVLYVEYPMVAGKSATTLRIHYSST